MSKSNRKPTGEKKSKKGGETTPAKKRAKKDSATEVHEAPVAAAEPAVVEAPKDPAEELGARHVLDCVRFVLDAAPKVKESPALAFVLVDDDRLIATDDYRHHTAWLGAKVAPSPLKITRASAEAFAAVLAGELKAGEATESAVRLTWRGLIVEIGRATESHEVTLDRFEAGPAPEYMRLAAPKMLAHIMLGACGPDVMGWRGGGVVDVFTAEPYLGNPVAVVQDGSDLSDAQMQAFARWTNLSETIFLLPPTVPEASYRVRIFTPRSEMPFAGHPSVGAVHALLESGGAAAADTPLLQECAAGLLPVRIENGPDERRIFVRAPSARVIAEDTDDRLLNEALSGMRRGDLPIALLDNGPRWWLAELEDEAAVRELRPALDAIAGLCRETSAAGLAVFAKRAGGDKELVVRAFCPADGVDEDPVTGSANACRIAVMNIAQIVIGRRNIVMPGARIWMMVVM